MYRRKKSNMTGLRSSGTQPNFYSLIAEMELFGERKKYALSIQTIYKHEIFWLAFTSSRRTALLGAVPFRAIGWCRYELVVHRVVMRWLSA
jgi:hypothetical protein